MTGAEFEYPNHTTEVFFGVPAAIYAGVGILMLGYAMIKGKDRSALFPYWAMTFLCAFKGLLLLGVSGVPSTAKDVDGEQAMTFPVRYWVDLVAFGFFAFEISARNKEENYDSSMRKGSIVCGLIGTSLFALTAAYSGSRSDWLSVPGIIFYSLFAVISFATTVRKSMKNSDKYGINRFPFWFEVSGFLWRGAYLSAFICSPAFADVVSVQNTALWFMILDIVFALWIGTHYIKNIEDINFTDMFSADAAEYSALPASNTSTALSQLRK